MKVIAATGAAVTTAGCEPSGAASEQTQRSAGGSSGGGASPATAGPHPVKGVSALGSPPWQTDDPFLFCVHHDDAYPEGNEHLGPAASLAGRRIGMDFEGIDGWRMYHGQRVPGFPSHPHRGFETVTVVRQGLLDHSDSLGAAARYGNGDVQWLTAGGGIMHSEMFPLLRSDRPNPVDFFQIWLNLPRVNKMVDPHFSMLWADTIPRVVQRDEAGRQTEVTVVAGSFAGQEPPSPPPNSWASRADSDVAIWTVRMAPGATWTLPASPSGVNRSLYFYQGSGVKVAGREVPAGQRIVLRDGLEAPLEAGPDEVQLLMLQGRPIGEPVVQHGPFVMNDRAGIQQAFADYRRTQFGGWPWDSDEPVHGREGERFARHADGSIDRPA